MIQEILSINFDKMMTLNKVNSIILCIEFKHQYNEKTDYPS